MQAQWAWKALFVLFVAGTLLGLLLGVLAWRRRSGVPPGAIPASLRPSSAAITAGSTGDLHGSELATIDLTIGGTRFLSPAHGYVAMRMFVNREYDDTALAWHVRTAKLQAHAGLPLTAVAVAWRTETRLPFSAGDRLLTYKNCGAVHGKTPLMPLASLLSLGGDNFNNHQLQWAPATAGSLQGATLNGGAGAWEPRITVLVAPDGYVSPVADLGTMSAPGSIAAFKSFSDLSGVRQTLVPALSAADTENEGPVLFRAAAVLQQAVPKNQMATFINSIRDAHITQQAADCELNVFDASILNDRSGAVLEATYYPSFLVPLIGPRLCPQGLQATIDTNLDAAPWCKLQATAAETGAASDGPVTGVLPLAPRLPVAATANAYFQVVRDFKNYGLEAPKQNFSQPPAVQYYELDLPQLPRTRATQHAAYVASGSMAYVLHGLLEVLYVKPHAAMQVVFITANQSAGRILYLKKLTTATAGTATDTPGYTLVPEATTFTANASGQLILPLLLPFRVAAAPVRLRVMLPLDQTMPSFTTVSLNGSFRPAYEAGAVTRRHAQTPYVHVAGLPLAPVLPIASSLALHADHPQDTLRLVPRAALVRGIGYTLTLQLTLATEVTEEASGDFIVKARFRTLHGRRSQLLQYQEHWSMDVSANDSLVEPSFVLLRGPSVAIPEAGIMNNSGEPARPVTFRFDCDIDDPVIALDVELFGTNGAGTVYAVGDLNPGEVYAVLP